MENWTVLKYNNLIHYEVSDLGNVRNSKKEIIKPWLNNSGYKCVKLYSKGFRFEFKVHRLVLLAFKPEQMTTINKEVHHIDNNRENNVISNLSWCSRKLNMQYMHDRRKPI